ncbi:RNA polymerase sigma factor SigY [Paenibacillus selenitireducens]|uniref:RNA polymerase sigma factor SigY n=1 Tax=Paenibacillus selenitireducens TaxID=1324314 RepID=A0A1T2X3A0_9BACL|nr:RNA polymerase sigma factor SigY [Paenibacillus selenitireducens]OPA74330.1 RNA polymerase sigma factor SigY [Paenibacillus selenitireducens]
MDEQQRIEQAIRGDNQALAQLLHEHYTFLMKYLIKVTMNPTLAEDLVQETMLKCIEKISSYNGTSKFSSWLITIATRLYIDMMRRKKVEQRWQEQEQALRKVQWHMQQQQEAWTDAIDALSKMRYEIRLPILLKHYYGYAYEDIAEMMDIPIGTVKSRIYNGLQQLRKELMPDGTA